ncbi:MAG TPA: FtsX-like permease family protein [Actinomycetota bacterium]|nr:FtsX-like permease family protein [Actinomycetota bacterium]
MTLFKLLNLRRFTEHRARTALSISGIAIGSALLVAVLGLLGSLTGSVEGFISDLAGSADLEVSAVSNEGLDERLFFDVEETEGVEAAIPMIRSRALVNRQQVMFLGVDQRAQLLGTELAQDEQETIERLAAEPGILIGEPLASAINAERGSTVTVFSTAGEKQVPVVGVVGGEAGRFNDGMFAVAPLPTAQQLLGKGPRIDSIFVIAQQGQSLEGLRRSLSLKTGSGTFVDSPAGRVRQAQSSTASLRFGMLMGVSIAVTVGAFLVYNTMSMAALERRREIATLRALGGGRRMLLRYLLWEAALLGLIGSVIGSFVGLVLAGILVRAIPDFYTNGLGVGVQLNMPSYAIPTALVVGIVSSVVAAAMPAMAAVKVAPASAMRPVGVLEALEDVQGVAPIPTFVGIAIFLGSFFTAIWGPGSLGFVAMGGLVVGAIVATFGLTHPIANATARFAEKFGVAGRLAASAVRRAPRRAWATSVAVVAGVGMIVTQASASANINTSVIESTNSLGRVDLYVSAASGVALATDVLLPAEWEAQLQAMPGVENVGTNTFSFVSYQGERVLVQGTSKSQGAEPAMAGITPEQRVQVQEGTAAVVSTRFEELFNIGPGDQLTLPTPSGERDVQVIASVPSFTWERGLVTIGRRNVIDWFGRTGVSDYQLTFEDGADPEAVRARVEEFVRDSPVPVYVSSGSEYLQVIEGTVKQVRSLFDAMVGVVVGAAVLAIINALIISVIERRTELGIMRALGTSRKQLRSMVAVEAGALGVVGGLVGVAFGFLAHRAAMVAVGHQGGMPVEYAFVWTPALIAFPLGIAMAILGSLEPARRAGSISVIEAIGYE